MRETFKNIPTNGPVETTRAQTMLDSGATTDRYSALALARSGGRTRFLTRDLVPDDQVRARALGFHAAGIGGGTFHGAYAKAVESMTAQPAATRKAG